MTPSKMPSTNTESYDDVAVVIPCYNEALTVGDVIIAAKQYLPGARIYVYDNNSSDGTDEVAAAKGAIVRREIRQGKGYVMRRASPTCESRFS